MIESVASASLCATLSCSPSKAVTWPVVEIPDSNITATANIVATKKGITSIKGVAYRPAKSSWHEPRPLAADSVKQKIMLTALAKTNGSAVSLRTLSKSWWGRTNERATNATVARTHIPLKTNVGVSHGHSIAFSPGSAPLRMRGPTQVVYRRVNPKKMLRRVW